MSHPPGEGVTDRIEVGDGARLFTRRWPVDDPVAGCLLLHGLGDHSGRYGELARVLTGHGLTVAAFDLRGHGRSPGRRGDAPSLEACLEEIDTVAREARISIGGGRPWFLFGHSMGGLLALLYALERPPPDLRGLLVSAPWIATRTPVPAWKELLGRLLRRVAPGVGLSTGLNPDDLSRDPSWVRAYRDDPLVHHRISPRLYHLVGRAQERVRRGELNVPALFLVPEDAPLVDGDAARRLAERVGADLRTFSGFRHEAFGELGRERFFRAVEEWVLARVDRDAHQNPGVA